MNFATAFPSDYNSPHNLLDIFCEFFMVPKVYKHAVTFPGSKLWALKS